MRYLSIALLAGLVACGQNSSSSTTSADTASVSSAVASQISGSYALRVRIASNQDVPLIGKVSSSSSLYKLAKISSDGTSFSLAEKGCEFAYEGGTAPLKLSIDKKLIRSASETTSALTVLEKDGVVSFSSAPTTVVVGANLSDPIMDALPTAENDSRVVDVDSDGHPGATASASGKIGIGIFKKEVVADIYFVQRTTESYSGTLNSAGLLSGFVTDKTEQSLLGSNNFLLKLAGSLASTQDPDLSKSTIEFVKIPDNATCDDVSFANVFAGK